MASIFVNSSLRERFRVPPTRLLSHHKPKKRTDFFFLTFICPAHILIVPDRQQRVSVQALKYNSVPECLVMPSFREGLCSETSNRSRLWKKMLITVLKHKIAFRQPTEHQKAHPACILEDAR